MFSVSYDGIQGKRPILLSLAVNFREPQNLIIFCRVDSCEDLLAYPIDEHARKPIQTKFKFRFKLQNLECNFSSL